MPRSARSGRRASCPVASAAWHVRRVEQRVVRRLQDRAELRGVRLRADLLGWKPLLRLEDGLPGLDEQLQVVALVVLEALLVDREVELREQFRDLAEVVLQTD